jgi:hypothetical protein
LCPVLAYVTNAKGIEEEEEEKNKEDVDLVHVIIASAG